ncbi:D-alanyl-D-alanine dipeptidase [Dysgonomonas sp. PFB1-18]|nr:MULTISPECIES: M15 family metallopeptidase [unclassified Dysgonomonas]MDH6307424.1 D-alanyl-D-alanine dipeptidase [Dysgonomonas sp. PF1-14]MDH6337342.1 D-alanyl-D-alanine dipeptidase [Dysgonomonas sp. PF1-16]MDH6379266.1 D-alanyl-D-alanine dipeptidase [Dysgonomonas sp. PFB1-18]
MKIKIHPTIFILTILFLIPLSLSAQSGENGLEAYLQTQKLTNVSQVDKSICYDLKYATTDNFTKTILYDSLLNIYLHPLAATKLIEAQKYLKALHPELSLLVYDAVRPLSVQRKMYNVVQNTKYAAYVANPSRTGLHNYGMAVDLTICDTAGKPLDMGTPFDFFGAAAGINREAELVQKGVLTRQQVKNRELLRKVMTHAGFLTIRGEWWHFNAVSLTEARRQYKVIE